MRLTPRNDGSASSQQRLWKQSTAVEGASSTTLSGAEAEHAVVRAKSGTSADRFSSVQKVIIAATVIFMNFNTTMGSSLPSGASETLNQHFGVTSTLQTPLPVSIFLTGYIIGPLVFAPMSEFYGRRLVFLVSFALYTIFLGASIAAPNWPAFLVFRLLMGCGAAAPQMVSGGLFSDIFVDLKTRGLAMTVLGLTSNVGPLVGPIISGFTSQSDWRWQFYIALVLVAANWPSLLWMPETFAPVLEAQAPSSQGSQTNNTNNLAKLFLFRTARASNGKKFSLQETLLRPFQLTLDPLVFFTDLFILYQYTIFFLYFNIYPYVFQGTYGLSSGVSSLMLLPIAVGALLAIVIFLCWDAYHRSAVKAGKAWALQEEYRRLPLACLGGPLFAAAQFWLGWAASPNVHWIVPALSGIPLGIGIDLTFLALQNYLTDAYGVFSASALASTVITRNIIAAVLLPTASFPLYERLGTAWASTLLGCLCVTLVVIPFAFLKWGPLLREKSHFCRALAAEKAESESAEK